MTRKIARGPRNQNLRVYEVATQRVMTVELALSTLGLWHINKGKPSFISKLLKSDGHLSCMCN